MLFGTFVVFIYFKGIATLNARIWIGSSTTWTGLVFEIIFVSGSRTFDSLVFAIIFVSRSRMVPTPLQTDNLVALIELWTDTW